MPQKPSTLKNKVTNILTRSQKSRNNNLTLYKHVLNEFYNTDMKTITAHDLFQGIANKDYPNYDAITRCSRKLQEEDINLRGSEWEERHKLEQPIINDLKNNF
tara:strand:- start:4426 stop:4734 length:309 start_codon:yes stop_codon:yes gene_type:complete